MSPILIVLLVVLVLVGVGFGIWGLVRHQYVQSLRERGWEFITSPDISIAYGLNVPPFGIGFERKVDDQITGQASDGTPFSAFIYKSDQYRTSGYAIRMPLPAPLPPAEVFGPSAPALPLTGARFEAGACAAVSPVPDLAGEVLSAIGPTLNGPWRISIDHANLVLIDAPKPAAELAAAIEDLASARRALLNSPAAARRSEPAPAGLSFYGKPTWEYIPQDDRLLDQIEHSQGGSNHEAKDIILGLDPALPFIRLKHTWQTTSTSTDSNGNSRTETHYHSEELCEFRPTFTFADFALNWGLFGRTQKFELESFNKRFRVTASTPRFASDVVHQRQMEYLMQVNAPSFQIAQGRIRFSNGIDWLPSDIESADTFLRGFFARVPDFVWQQLGAWPRPLPELTD